MWRLKRTHVHRDDLLAARRFSNNGEDAIAQKECQATATFDLGSKSTEDPEIKFLTVIFMTMTRLGDQILGNSIHENDGNMITQNDTI